MRQRVAFWAMCTVVMEISKVAVAEPTATRAGAVNCGQIGCAAVTFMPPLGMPPNNSNISLTGINGSFFCSPVIVGGVTRQGFQPYLKYDQSRSLTCNYNASGTDYLHSLAIAKYMVLTVIYAPPGAVGGMASSVSYQTGSSAGTSVSSSSTFTNSGSVSVDISGGVLVGGDVSTGFNYSASQNDTNSVSVTKTTTNTLSLSGPSSDSISHDDDLIGVLLNVPIDVGINPNVTPPAVDWRFGAKLNHL